MKTKNAFSFVITVIAKAAPKKKRDVFLFVISGAKVRNPSAAQAIIAAL